MLLTEEEKNARLSRAYSGKRNVPDKLHKATQGLFWEYRHSSRAKQKGFSPVYNLSKTDHNDTLSMQQIYFQCETDYEAGLVLLGDFDHWNKLKSCEWFQKHLQKWEQEKLERVQAEARGLLLKRARGGDLHAIKYLDKLNSVSVKPNQEAPVKEVPKTIEQPCETETQSWARDMLSRIKE